MISTRRRPENLPDAILPNGDVVDFKTESDTKFGADIMDEAIKEPTLDRFLDRYYKKNTMVDYAAAVALLQKKRALYINAKAERKDKKANIGDTNEEV